MWRFGAWELGRPGVGRMWQGILASRAKLTMAKEKLTKAVGAQKASSGATGPSCDGGKGFDLNIKSKLGELADETPGSRLGGAVVEMVGAEILVLSTGREHVVDRGQHRRGYGTQRLLGATTAAQAIELSLKIAALLAGCGPGALDEHGLEPRGAFAQAGRPALARALVIARTKPGPGQQMGRRATETVGHRLAWADGGR